MKGIISAFRLGSSFEVYLGLSGGKYIYISTILMYNFEVLPSLHHISFIVLLPFAS